MLAALPLNLDDWKKIGPKQMGQKCGRGWVGLRGACERASKHADVDAAIKASRVGLAAKIRAKKQALKQVSLASITKAVEPPVKNNIAALPVGSVLTFTKDLQAGLGRGHYAIKGFTHQGRTVSVVRLSSKGEPVKGARDKLLSIARLEAPEIASMITVGRVDIEKKPQTKRSYENATELDLGSRTRLGPSVSPENVITADKRFNNVALNKALDTLDTPGAPGRVAFMRQFIESRGVQVVFNSTRSTAGQTDKLFSALKNTGEAYKKNQQRLEELEQIAEADPSYGNKLRLEARQRASRQIKQSLVGRRRKAHGYAHPETMHVVVTAENHGRYSKFEVEGSQLSKSADSLFTSFKEGKPQFSASGNTIGPAGDLITFIHEVGHHVQWQAEKKLPQYSDNAPALTSGITRYGRTSKQEQFADHFALWLLDADRLKEVHPAMHKYIDDAVLALGTDFPEPKSELGPGDEFRSKRRQRTDRTDAIGGSPLTARKQRANEIAATALGRASFFIVFGAELEGSGSYGRFLSLLLLNERAETPEEIEETGAAIDAFLSAGGEFAPSFWPEV